MRLIAFSWDIHHKCNYRCPYCWFNGNWVEERKSDLNLSAEEWVITWDKVYSRYGEAQIDIVGGEPFTYPSFLELLKKLSKKHCMGVCTNLFFDHKIFLSKRMDPDCVSLNATFHPLFVDLETFLNKAIILKREGYLKDIHFVAYPPIINRLTIIKKRFEEEEFIFDIQPFWGYYNGKTYPDNYSSEEKEVLYSLIGEKGCIDYRVNKKSPRGKLCSAGYRYAFIKNNGEVTRCGRDYVLGNIVNAEFEMLEKPEPCVNTTCACADFQFLVGEDERQKRE